MTVSTVDINGIMAELAKSRPVFHSEADFQHSLAWQIREAMPDSQIRLEFKPFPHASRQIFLDIWVPSHGIALELKYLPRQLEISYNGESFVLKDQLTDAGRYDFLKDIQRLEDVCARCERASHGYAILLANEHLYWTHPQGGVTSDANFRLHEGRVLHGEMDWARRTSTSAMRGYDSAIRLRGRYELRWREYSHLDWRGIPEPDSAATRYRRFRYLVVEVESPA